MHIFIHTSNVIKCHLTCVCVQEINGIDNDVKSKFNQYSSLKTNLLASQRRQTGNLSTKSLLSVVPPSALIQDSEYLETHLLAVPNTLVKDFFKTYESLTDMIVPRSAQEIASDDEFTLYAVTTFKKFSGEFIHKAREKRWIPRDFKYKEGGKEEERKEVENLEREERKVWGEALRLGRTGYSESAMIWIHVLALRVFVETVLRYGLPLDFVSASVQVGVAYSGWKISVLTTECRLRRNQQRRSRRTSTPITVIWVEMRLARTRRAGQRTIRALVQRPWRSTEVKSTMRLYTTNSRLRDETYRQKCLDLANRV